MGPPKYTIAHYLIKMYYIQLIQSRINSDHGYRKFTAKTNKMCLIFSQITALKHKYSIIVIIYVTVVPNFI